MQTKNLFKSHVLVSRLLVLALVMILTFGLATTAWAHQTVTVGAFTVEYGWVTEPAIVGQPNAVVINLSQAGASSDAVIDTSGLKIEVGMGGQTKTLTLQPLGENTPNQFIAPMTPTRPGKYTIHLSGSIAGTAFNNDVTPEEVQTADVVQFPPVDSMQPAAPASAPMGAAGWLGLAGVVFGLIGMLLGIIALARKPAKG
jgi:hypothetical protein